MTKEGIESVTHRGMASEIKRWGRAEKKNREEKNVGKRGAEGRGASGRVVPVTRERKSLLAGF